MVSPSTLAGGLTAAAALLILSPCVHALPTAVTTPEAPTSEIHARSASPGSNYRDDDRNLFDYYNQETEYHGFGKNRKNSGNNWNQIDRQRLMDEMRPNRFPKPRPSTPYDDYDGGPIDFEKRDARIPIRHQLLEQALWEEQQQKQKQEQEQDSETRNTPTKVSKRDEDDPPTYTRYRPPVTTMYGTHPSEDPASLYYICDDPECQACPRPLSPLSSASNSAPNSPKISAQNSPKSSAWVPADNNNNIIDNININNNNVNNNDNVNNNSNNNNDNNGNNNNDNSGEAKDFKLNKATVRKGPSKWELAEARYDAENSDPHKSGYKFAFPPFSIKIEKYGPDAEEVNNFVTWDSPSQPGRFRTYRGRGNKKGDRWRGNGKRDLGEGEAEASAAALCA
ncbi:hypothetical protein V8F20_012385 [Naviculisporaceae sp. PSN 640]